MKATKISNPTIESKYPTASEPSEVRQPTIHAIAGRLMELADYSRSVHSEFEELVSTLVDLPPCDEEGKNVRSDSKRFGKITEYIDEINSNLQAIHDLRSML